MKRIISIVAFALALVSCNSLIEEFQPVFTTTYEAPKPYAVSEIEPNITIADLCAMYITATPWNIDRNLIIAGKVSTTDKPGNFYKSLYIQDETGGIELKIGKNGLYNYYSPGQTLKVRCFGMTLGMYGYKSGNYGGQGMIQLGYEDPTKSYETAYFESAYFIDSHILPGEVGEEVVPAEITEEQLPGPYDTQSTNQYIGKLVTLKNLTYGNKIFCLMYINSNMEKTLSANRIFLSDKTWGVTTWAMSENKFKEYFDSGLWDEVKIGNSGDYNYGTVGEPNDPGFATSKADIRAHSSAYSVSQYFKMGNTDIALRTSGYSKFSDEEIPQAVLDGTATVDITGVLTMYQGTIQIVVNSREDIVIH
ncbi:MAG: hypothetical protein IJR25_02655 [Bacteroidales bacterium]|nr:hypothetical protein [Bacteroidales bacterium]